MNAIPAKRVAVVAELGANHGGRLETALELVAQAAAAGAHAVKIQTWAPGKMVLDRALVLDNGPWAGWNLAELYERAWTPWDWHGPIFEACKRHNVVGFTSVFDLESLLYLEQHHRVPVYKIASFELIDHELIRAVAGTGKAMVLSTGMATRLEIEEAVAIARGSGCKDITVLKCVSAYPASADGTNLITMKDMASRFDVRVGLSDHSQGIACAVVAAAMGAKMIEKHMRLPSQADGLDVAFSATPDELALLVRAVEQSAVCVGDAIYGPTIAEGPQLALRRSLHLAKDIRAGERITMEHLRTARPASGLAPRFLKRLIGRAAIVDAKAGSPVTWGLIEPADAIQEAVNSRP